MRDLRPIGFKILAVPAIELAVFLLVGLSMTISIALMVRDYIERHLAMVLVSVIVLVIVALGSAEIDFSSFQRLVSKLCR